MTTASPLTCDQRDARILVLGAAGQLGQALIEAGGSAAIGLTRTDLDITNRNATRSVIGTLQPKLVINAAAYTAVDRAESDAVRAFAINRDGAAHVAEACAENDLPLIHLSTDYVFDGGKVVPYREDDPVAPLSVYGLSKAAGEELVRARHARSVILRTSWLFAVTGHNFVKTILNLARERTELRIVADQLGCPTPATDLASAVLALARIMLDESNQSGIFHFAGLQPISWHDFAVEIVGQAAAALPHQPRLTAISTAEYPTPARRPTYSVLDCRKLQRLGIEQRSWRPALAQIIDQLLGADASRRPSDIGSVSCPIFS